MKGSKYYREILDKLPQGVFEIDPEGKLLYLNYAGLHLLKINKITKIKTENIFSFFTDSEKLKTVFSECKAGDEIKIVCEIQSEDDDYVPVLIEAAGVFENENLTSIRGTLTKNAEDRNSTHNISDWGENKFKTILDNIPVPIGITDVRGKIQYINPAYVELFGYSAQEIPELNYWLEKAYPDIEYRNKCVEQWMKDINRVKEKSDTISPTRIYSIVSKSGKVLDVEITFRLIGDALYTLFNDITDKKDMARQYQTLFENTGSEIIVIEDDYTISLVNNSFAKKLGYTREEIENRIKITQLVIEEDLPVLEALHDFISVETEKTKNVLELGLKTRSNEVYYYEVYISTIPNTKKLTASLIDNSESRRNKMESAERERRIAAQRAGIAKLVSQELFISGDLEQILFSIVKMGSEIIDTARASVWTLADDNSKLDCKILYEKNLGKISSGYVLDPDTFPEYFKTMENENRVYAEDAVNDSRTKGLAEDYLIPLGITSLLDSCMIVDGKMRGVISFEHVGPKRKWQADEESFVSTLAAITAQSFVNFERRKAIEELSQSEERFRSIMEQSAFSMMVLSTDGYILHVNKAHKQLWGVEPSMLTEYNILMDKQLENLGFIDLVKKALDGERISLPAVDYDLTATLGQGHHITVQGDFYPIKDNDGNVKYIILIHQDISDRKKAEEDLRKSRELFKTLLESNPNAISLVGFDGKYIMVNKAFAKYADKNADEIIGRDAKEIGFSGRQEDNSRLIKELLDKGYVENYEMEVSKNGKTYNLLTFAIIVEIGEQKAILSTRIDITDRKNLEAKLLESEALFREIVTLIPYSLVISDSEGKYTFANRAFNTRHNLKENEAIGKTSKDLGIITSEEDDKKLMDELEQTGIINNLEITISSPTKEETFALISGRQININGKEQLIISTVDITRRKQLENQLLEYNQQLEIKVKERTEKLAEALQNLKDSNEELQVINDQLLEQQRQLEEALRKLSEAQEQLIQTEKMASLGILTAGVAHEINNPINYIYNGAAAIEGYIKENLPEHKKELDLFFGAISTGISRTTNIVRSLSKYSRKDSGVLAACSVYEIIESCLTILYNQYKNRIAIKKEYSENVTSIMVHEGRLHQAFLNVLLNSIQAIEDKGEILVNVSLEDQKVKIRIADNGCGISEENLKHIFDPFFTTKDPGKGTGLGLSIAQSIIREHNGTIQCKSSLNTGTEIIINLPVNV